MARARKNRATSAAAPMIHQMNLMMSPMINSTPSSAPNPPPDRSMVGEVKGAHRQVDCFRTQPYAQRMVLQTKSRAVKAVLFVVLAVGIGQLWLVVLFRV